VTLAPCQVLEEADEAGHPVMMPLARPSIRFKKFVTTQQKS
jgi:hypothetical protein